MIKRTSCVSIILLCFAGCLKRDDSSAPNKDTTPVATTVVSDLEQNGLFLSEFIVSVEDDDSHVQLADVFTLANIGLSTGVMAQIKDAHLINLKTFIVPFTGGYRVVALSHRRLDKNEQAFIWSEAKVAIDEARVKRANSKTTGPSK